MAAREDMGTNVEPGFIQRIAAGVRYAITGVGPENWFGPMQPLPPQAQDKTEGRAFDYPVGYNLRILPRSEEAVGFWQLRALADGYDLMRLAIETRKDQIEAYEWEITPKDKSADAEALKSRIAEATTFLEYPDKEHDWSEWLRLVVEDMLVIDAVCVYPRMNRGGKLYGLELVDGATVKRLIDETGRTPMAPNPAYQQILKGIPAADYSRDQLSYWMRNQRTWKLYGYSPVEQVLMTVNIALRRQVSQLQYYTEGNIPEAIAQLPKDWDAKTTQQFQAWWDSLMEGNTAQRRKMKFIPNLDGILFPKQGVLKDEYDEWLARIICFAFSISPTALVKQVNRATAEQSADTAKEEGLFPTLRWLASKITFLLNGPMGYPDLAFRWKIQNKVDPLSQAQIDNIYTAAHIVTPDEVRDTLGMEAMTDEQREKAWPTSPALDPEQQGSAGEGEPSLSSKGNDPKKPGKPDADDGGAAEKIVVNVAPPAIYLGDTLVRVAAPEAPVTNVTIQPPATPNVSLTLGDTEITVPGQEPKIEKRAPRRMRAERKADGSMVFEELEDENA